MDLHSGSKLRYDELTSAIFDGTRAVNVILSFPFKIYNRWLWFSRFPEPVCSCMTHPCHWFWMVSNYTLNDDV